MVCYRITNKINGKKYIGITISFQDRIKQHKKQKTKSLIHQAIKKYGEDNFIYEIIEDGLTIIEAEQIEIKLIQSEKSLAPNGYNLAKGGLHGGTKKKISDEQIAYIKNNRNKPMYILYEEFSDIICYGYFKQIYKNQIRQDIIPQVEEYPHNAEFSSQFCKTKMTYSDIVEIRKSFKDLKNWKDIYPKYKDKVSEATFYDIFRGQQFKLIMPEVFSSEIKEKRKSISCRGEKNGNAILTEKDVKNIRKLHSQDKKTIKKISILYPQVSYSSISDVIYYRSWKNV